MGGESARVDDLKDRPAAGEAITAFDFRREHLDVTWLRQFMTGAFLVSEGGSRRWLVSLIYPSTLWSLIEAIEGRAIHKQWREALSRSR
jgi:hypothetical protein